MTSKANEIAKELLEEIKRTEALVAKGDKPCHKHLWPVSFCYECYEENIKE